MVSHERFAKGMTFPQYLEQMGANRDRFVRLLGEITLGPEERAAPERPRRTRKVLVITEDWCGDALASLPALARLVEGNANVEMRVFLRDENPDLMDLFLNRGLYRSIPVFVFFDEHMTEVARFTQRPPAPTGPRGVIEHIESLLEA
jgi:hypothetical protein